MRGLEDDDLYPILRSTGSDTRLLLLFYNLFFYFLEKNLVFERIGLAQAEALSPTTTSCSALSWFQSRLKSSSSHPYF